MIPDFEITKFPEHEVKSKIGTIFVNEKILEEYSVKIYEIDPYFYEHYRKKIQTDENGSEYILFRIDIYFTEYSLAVEIDEKGHTDRSLIFEKKKKKQKKHQKEHLIVNLLELILVEKIMVQTMKLVEYKYLLVSFKKNKIKALEDKIKELELQLANQKI